MSNLNDSRAVTNSIPKNGKTTSDSSWVDTQDKILSPRYELIARLIAHGHATKYIAKRADVAITTVRSVAARPEVQARVNLMLVKMEKETVRAGKRIEDTSYDAADMKAILVEREVKKMREDETGKIMPSSAALAAASEILDRAGVGHKFNPDGSGSQHLHLHQYNVNQEKKDKLTSDFEQAKQQFDNIDQGKEINNQE